MQRATASLYAGTPLLALIAVYGIFALTTHLNIGHRHLLPIYPALIILAGGAAFWLQPLFERTRSGEAQNPANRRQQRSARAGLKGRAGLKTRPHHVFAGIGTVAMLVWHVAESATIRPDYLAYFNQLAGGPSQGYRHLADSSLDWGQDLPALKQWLDREGLQQPGGSNVYLSYFGTARPEYYGIKAIPLAGFIDRRPPQPPDPLSGGIYCISATVLDVIGPSFYKPEDESNYQAALQNLVAFARASENEAAWSALLRQTGEQDRHDLFKQFDQLRTGRLVAFLRSREPDAMVGYSILIYRLTDRDVALAVNGPPPAAPGDGELQDQRNTASKRRPPLAGPDLQARARRAGDASLYWALAVGLTAISCYVNAVGNEFVLDDTRLIRDNLRIRSLANIPHLFASSYWDVAGPQALYRPLVLVSYAVQYAMHGLSPAGYTIVNIALHAAVSVLLFALVRAIGGSLFAAGVAGIAFAVHPVHTEAVSGISGRPELLAAFFFLLAVHFHRLTPAGAAAIGPARLPALRARCCPRKAR